jgi:predicted nucleotidyltransferase
MEAAVQNDAARALGVSSLRLPDDLTQQLVEEARRGDQPCCACADYDPLMVVTPGQRDRWRQRWASEAARREERRTQLQSQALAIASTLRQRWPDLSLWLFGSVLGPGLHADSDLDLAVAGLPAGELPEALSLAEGCANAAERPASAAVAVDLVRLETLPIHWQERIRAEGQRLT